MKNNRRINIVSALCVSLLMAASTLIMSAEDDAGEIIISCSGGCNYGSVYNPNWLYVGWVCEEGQRCYINCATKPPTTGVLSKIVNSI